MHYFINSILFFITFNHLSCIYYIPKITLLPNSQDTFQVNLNLEPSLNAGQTNALTSILLLINVVYFIMKCSWFIWPDMRYINDNVSFEYIHLSLSFLHDLFLYYNLQSLSPLIRLIYFFCYQVHYINQKHQSIYSNL